MFSRTFLDVKDLLSKIEYSILCKKKKKETKLYSTIQIYLDDSQLEIKIPDLFGNPGTSGFVGINLGTPELFWNLKKVVYFKNEFFYLFLKQLCIFEYNEQYIIVLNSLKLINFI